MYTLSRYVEREFCTSGETFLYVVRDFSVMISTSHPWFCTSGVTTNSSRIQYYPIWSSFSRFTSSIVTSHLQQNPHPQVGNCCFLLHVVRFVSYAPVKHSGYFNNLNNVRFRFVIAWFLGKLWLDMHRWWSRISCTTTTENSESKLEIVVSCCTWYVSFQPLLSNILRVLIISTTNVSDL
jgi:hypothetical protein